jgi:hypothetical protein
MPYEQSDAAKRFLRRKFAADKDAEKCCDCPGCDTCKGFVRGCHCDDDWEAFRAARQTPKTL